MRTSSKLDEKERRRPVAVLALGVKTARLEDGGFRELGDLLNAADEGYGPLLRLPAFGRRSVDLVRERLAAVLSCAGPDGAVDWPAYRRLAGLAGDSDELPAPFATLDRERRVEELQLGARTDRLRAGGLDTVGRLLDDRAEGFASLTALPYVGVAVVDLVERRLRTLNVCRKANGEVDWAAFARLCNGEAARTPPATASGPEFGASLSYSARRRPVEALRLGAKARHLRQAGMGSIGRLLKGDAAGALDRAPGFGRQSRDLVRERLRDLVASADESGEPRWDDVAAAWGYPVVPDRSLVTGEDFVDAAPVVFGAWIAAHENEADRQILRERLLRPKGERLTLDELGRRLQLTRERVRQREKALVDGLADALISDDQSRSPVQFSSNYREWWGRAAEALAAAERLDYAGFISGLERAWGVPAWRLSPLVPLALAVLSEAGQVEAPRTPPPPRLLAPLPPELLRTPITSFPVGRALFDLQAADCRNFGGLLLAAAENRLPQGRSGAAGLRILNAVAAALDEAGSIVPERYAEALGVPLLPRTQTNDGADLLRSFDDVISEAAKHGRTSARAAEVWHLRTSRPAPSRPTLEETAAELGTWGPSIKREETLLLSRMHDQLVERLFSEAGVVWRVDFLDRVSEAAAEHDVADNYEDFVQRLASRWLLDITRVRRDAAGLWAVLSLYPAGRRRRSRHADVVSEEASVTFSPPPLIVLRGFRRAH